MEDNGSIRERWQYRQEMKAHGAWDHWGLPTREDYEQFQFEGDQLADARALLTLMKTWRPDNIEAYGLGKEGLMPPSQADKEVAYALLAKHTTPGLSEAEVRAYAQVVNRWEAEHTMLAGGEQGLQALFQRLEGLTHPSETQAIQQHKKMSY